MSWGFQIAAVCICVGGSKLFFWQSLTLYEPFVIEEEGTQELPLAPWGCCVRGQRCCAPHTALPSAQSYAAIESALLSTAYMLSFASTNFLVISALFFLVSSPGILRRHPSPLQKDQYLFPCFILYFFPAPSDTASSTAYPLLLLSIYFHVLPSRWTLPPNFFSAALCYHLPDLPYHPEFLTQLPAILTTVHCLPPVPSWRGCDITYLQTDIAWESTPTRFLVERVPNQSIIWWRQ